MQAVINLAINYVDVSPLLSILLQIFTALRLKGSLLFVAVLGERDEIKLTEDEREALDADGCCGMRSVRENECVGMSQ